MLNRHVDKITTHFPDLLSASDLAAGAVVCSFQRVLPDVAPVKNDPEADRVLSWLERSSVGLKKVTARISVDAGDRIRYSVIVYAASLPAAAGEIPIVR